MSSVKKNLNQFPNEPIKYIQINNYYLKLFTRNHKINIKWSPRYNTVFNLKSKKLKGNIITNIVFIEYKNNSYEYNIICKNNKKYLLRFKNIDSDDFTLKYKVTNKNKISDKIINTKDKPSILGLYHQSYQTLLCTISIWLDLYIILYLLFFQECFF